MTRALSSILVDAARVWRAVASAPLTYLWLVALLITTLVQHSTDPDRLQELLESGSTNVHHLLTVPEEVLFSSLLWIDGWYWWPYLVVFTLFLAPAERWLGQLRWLAVGLLSHVVATYISEGLLYLTIAAGEAPRRLIDVRDIGVSYFVVGIIGVLTYHVARPWRWCYLAVMLLGFGAALVLRPELAPLGHFCSLLVGLACYPCARRRAAAAWDPAIAWSRLRHRPRPAA